MLGVHRAVDRAVPLFHELLRVGDGDDVVHGVGDDDVFLGVLHRQSERVELPAADVQHLVGVNVGTGVVTAEHLSFVGQSLVAAPRVDRVATLFQPLAHSSNLFMCWAVVTRPTSGRFGVGERSSRTCSMMGKESTFENSGT